MIAREIGTARVIVPRAPGHFCAFGMLFSNLRHDFVRTWPSRLASLSFDVIERVYGEMIAQGRAALARGGHGGLKAAVRRYADMRYVGQEHAVTIELPDAFFRKQDRAAIKTRFDEEHQLRYGTCAPAEQAEIVTLRVTVSGEMAKPKIELAQAGSRRPLKPSLRQPRKAWFGSASKAIETPVYDRDALRAGNRIVGPALIEEHASTTVLFPGDRLTVDPFGNLDIGIGASRA